MGINGVVAEKKERLVSKRREISITSSSITLSSDTSCKSDDYFVRKENKYIETAHKSLLRRELIFRDFPLAERLILSTKLLSLKVSGCIPLLLLLSFIVSLFILFFVKMSFILSIGSLRSFSFCPFHVDSLQRAYFRSLLFVAALLNWCNNLNRN